jgi:hypothetical protein
MTVTPDGARSSAAAPTIGCGYGCVSSGSRRGTELDHRTAGDDIALDLDH